MSTSFWDSLPRPIIALAPMADVTDVAFRRVIAKYGKPDVMWTEFVSVEGLTHPMGREKLLLDLAYDEIERPIVAQVFGADPEKFYEVARLCVELGFDGIDINMGCPVDSINRQRAGTDLIKNPSLAQEIVRATKQGVVDAVFNCHPGHDPGSRSVPIPVSVKTRAGYSQPSIETWIPQLLETEPAALILHARTKKEMSKVPAPWERIKQAREIRDAMGSTTLLIGNGDVENVGQAFARVEETGADGAMIGRGFFGNPWLCADLRAEREAWLTAKKAPGTFLNPKNVPGSLEDPREKLPWAERLRVLIEHAQLFEELIMPQKPFAVMRKHFGSYVSGFDGAKELRIQLMVAESASELEKILRDAGYPA
ncbi:MAG: hypothetical protein COV10_02360 [Candidatus Vogelbacteria bacterium CG10_big_fil_rev_8_21_14_0_10_51_16]|uniref:tRNA-dihydrouridine synthase n=1 Tax=Candidatus Vogelbacteria bacterium CG10_big_fil_rev_8_21_14_0_10_51_16 TaxID=1975045 RepID=A0A2H0RET1_9BACT|nr:MAG: hypothetical protein COV10_02360 [Candidatus Vogelbacteria bacterium CG10_big_fil_rev_8_21_14_0_10_51_16]